MSTLPSGYLIYGANGYTGELIAREAVVRGQRPILAGRSAAAVRALAQELGLESRAFGLDDPAALDAGLRDSRLVLNCAGPFSRTAEPVASACLRRGAHYLDVTGEIPVFEGLARRHAAAQEAGVMLLPGVGFDVVPSDCLAAHLKRRLPSATHLTLAFQAGIGASRGTATTMVENLDKGGLVRRDGRLARVPTAWRTRDIDFGKGPRRAVTIPWGDVSTAFHSTGIPNVEVYMAAPRSLILTFKLLRPLGSLLGSRPVQSFLKRRIQSRPPGPSAEQRARGQARLWGEARDEAGGRVVSRLTTPDGYTLTMLTALACVERTLAGQARPGFATPSLAFSADFVLEIPGVSRTDE
ncbi:MAG TPA: saccharopine dehydrogenase NADP-binding domain-containing protein [Vicinamibacteria bacterium]|nr:saccharopine dehydrogenase NADP-binding domain-containing protein [Vicinamibacteria bacterium]